MLYSTVLFTAVLAGESELQDKSCKEKTGCLTNEVCIDNECIPTKDFFKSVYKEKNCIGRDHTHCKKQDVCTWVEHRKKLEEKKEKDEEEYHINYCAVTCPADGNATLAECACVNKNASPMTAEKCQKNQICNPKAESKDNICQDANGKKDDELSTAEETAAQEKEELKLEGNKDKQTKAYKNAIAEDTTEKTEKTVTEDDLKSVRTARTEHEAEKKQREQEKAEQAAAEAAAAKDQKEKEPTFDKKNEDRKQDFRRKKDFFASKKTDAVITKHYTPKKREKVNAGIFAQAIEANNQ